MVAMPDGTNRGIVLMDLEEFAELASILLENET
jgi:hypothetical protein